MTLEVHPRVGRLEDELLPPKQCSDFVQWRGEELVRHKVFKRYVVRGRGRAQPTHLKSKGKSRYGSRLRL